MRSTDRRPLSSDAALAVLVLLLGVFLAGTGEALTSRWQRSAARNQSMGFDDILGFGANILGLVLVLWWVISALIAFVAAVLEHAGNRRAAAIAGTFTPRYMRRLALAALGLQLVTAPLANADTSPGSAWIPSEGSSVSAAWRAEQSDGKLIQPLNPRWQPSQPAVDPGLLAGTPLRAVQQVPETGAAPVTVIDGDSLWTIVATHLGPLASDVDIAQEWPRWYQINRAVIGENPDVLTPGQLLTPPGPA